MNWELILLCSNVIPCLTASVCTHCKHFFNSVNDTRLVVSVWRRLMFNETESLMVLIQLCTAAEMTT